MKKSLLFLITIVMIMFCLTGCTKEPRKEALDFKEEYESINDRVIRDDLKYRALSISEENPYIKVTPEEIVEKINNKETFYLYVGDPLCPWCRSGLEKMIEVAVTKGIKDIYYIDFWDDNHKEILRDLYEVQEVNKKYQVVKTQDSTEAYDKILKTIGDFAQDYTITKDDKTYDVGIKRLFGGDHFYFENGVCKKYVSLRSDKLANAFDELTEEVLNDQQTNFEKFFDNSENVCTSDSNC